MDQQRYQKSLLDTDQTLRRTELINNEWQFDWNENYKIAEIFCNEEIICRNIKSIYLLTRLVYSISLSTYFSGTVSIITLESPSFQSMYENAKLEIGSPQNKSNKRSFCLKFVYSIKGMQREQAKTFFDREIEQKNRDCKFIFLKITEILQSYIRVQNRLSFWISRLNEDLKKHYQTKYSRQKQRQCSNY